MRSLLGALLLMLSGGSAGIGAAMELRRREQTASVVLSAVERLRVLICLRRLTLPEALDRLGREFPSLFPVSEGVSKQLTEQSFSGIWAQRVEHMALFSPLHEILLTLGRDIAEGADLERSFCAALTELRETKEALAARRRSSEKLYIALGFSVGCLAAILMI